MRAPLSLTFDKEIYDQVPNGGILVLRVQNDDDEKKTDDKKQTDDGAAPESDQPD